VIAVRCADASAGAGEALAGTGMVADRWLLVESRLPWEREAVTSGFPGPLAGWLTALDAKVLAIRRPGRRGRTTVFAAETSETGSALRRLELDDVATLQERDPWVEGEPIAAPLFLVCTHGRRDACCSRLGIPVFHALEAIAGPDLVWQCSHTGGHRFAANVVALPEGLTFGRVEPHLAPDVVSLVGDRRIPLAHYRGRSLYDPVEQAAEVAVRTTHGIDAVDGLRLAKRDGTRVVFESQAGRRFETQVTENAGPAVPKSCGAEVEPTVAFAVTQVTESVGAG
jgi:hypothetical protein